MGCGNNIFCHIGKAGEAAVDKVTDLAKAAKDVFETVEESVESTLEATYDSIASVAKAARAVLEKFGEDIVGFVKVGGQLIYLLGDTLGQGLDYVVNAVHQGGILLAGEVYNFAGELLGFIVDGILWIVDSVVSVAEAALAVLDTVGEFVWDAVTLNPDIFNHLKDNFIDVCASILKVYETVVKGAFQIVGQLYEMTVGRMSGYLAGILSMIPVVGNFLSDTVRLVNDCGSFVLNFLEVLASIPNTLGCVFSNFLNDDAELHTLLPSLIEYPDTEIALGRVKVLPPPSSSVKYAVLSDMHLFFDSELDYYSDNEVNKLHRRLLNHLADSQYHLIENGDIEDLWRRDSGDLDQHGSIGANQIEGLKAQLREVIDNNLDLYNLIHTRFERFGRYSRTIGNHDLPMMHPSLQCVLRQYYPSTIVNEFILIGDGINTPSHLIAHGHQLDQFNRSGCTWFGESITRLVSRWDMMFGFAEHMSTSDEDIDPLFNVENTKRKGRKNVLNAHRMFGCAQLDEPALFKQYVKLNKRMDLPWIILGHSHDPLYMPGYEENDKTVAAWAPKPKTANSFAAGGYANTGTSGMWKKIVWFLTIEQIPGTKEIATLLHAARLRNGNELDIATFKSDGPSSEYGNDGSSHVGLVRIPAH